MRCFSYLSTVSLWRDDYGGCYSISQIILRHSSKQPNRSKCKYFFFVTQLLLMCDHLEWVPLCVRACANRHCNKCSSLLSLFSLFVLGATKGRIFVWLYENNSTNLWNFGALSWRLWCSGKGIWVELDWFLIWGFWEILVKFSKFVRLSCTVAPSFYMFNANWDWYWRTEFLGS